MTGPGFLPHTFSTLKDHDIDFVIVGGMARILHGSEFMTVDVDIVIDNIRSNLNNLIVFAKKEGYRFRISGKLTKIKNPEDLFLIPFIELVHKKKPRIVLFLGETYDHVPFDLIDWQRKKVGDLFIKVATMDFLIEHSGDRPKDQMRKEELMKISKNH
jgi:hypothetical protein